MKMEVELISKELIRPSSPTPDHLRHYHLSFIDQIQAPTFSAFFLFYSEKSNIINNLKTKYLLKKSLSQALTNFYPLAGRIKNNSIECNDEGLLFVEAKANCQLSVILGEKNPDNNKKLMPVQSDEADILAAFCQITSFKCGGLAISFAISHKLGDALSQFMFLNSWAAIARSGNTHINIPSFGSAAIFPPTNIPGFKLQTLISKKNIVTKVFAFDASAIEALIAKYTTVDGGRPSRVEAVVAFIWSRFMATTQAEEAKNNKLYTLVQAVNLRTRMAPPLHKLSFGNLIWFAIAEADMEAKDDDSYGIVNRMKDSTKNMSVDNVKKLQNKDEQLIFLENLAKVYDKEKVVSFVFSSLCNFPAYETDFGWGKPSWVGLIPQLAENGAIFFDSREGQGIEAWICLTEEDMAKFEIDNQLVAHVSSTANGNPLPAQSRL